MKRALFATLSLLIAPAAWAETLEDALVAAHRTNPNLDDARLAVRAAREDRAQARAAYLPTVDVSASTGLTHTDTDVGAFHQDRDLDPQSQTLRMTQQVFTSGRRTGQTRLARAGVASAQQGLRATEQNVLIAAVEVYLNVRRDREIVRLRETHVQGLEEQLRGARRRLEVGEVSRTDVAQAQTRLAAARAGLARARADAAESEITYTEIVGTAPQDLVSVTAPPQTPGSLEAAVRQAETTHPVLLQARYAVHAARARVTIERAALLPQVSLVGRMDKARDTEFDDQLDQSSSAVAQFSMPLFEGGYAWSRTHQGEINVERAQARVEAQRRQIVSNVVTAWSDVEAERQVIDAAHEQEAASQTALSGVERERGLGLRTTLDVLNAQEEVLNAQIELARAEASSTLAAYALLEATGALSLDALGLHD